MWNTLTRVLAATTLIVLMFAVRQQEQAKADLNFNGYLWECSPSYCALKDPINVLFDVNGTLSNTINEVRTHLGWSSTSGANLKFVDHGQLEDPQAQYASGCTLCSRYHARYNQGNDNGGPGWGIWTMAPVHYEIVTRCGHVTTTFDGARNYVKNTFANSGHHPTGFYWKGNTQASQQCDGSWVAGDGYFAYIDIL